MCLLLFLTWIILNGRITGEIVLFGLIFTAVIGLFLNKAIGYKLENDVRIMKNLPLMLLYILNLILEILKASGAVIKVAVSGRVKPDPVIIEFHSGLAHNYQNVLLANSITLTPGTFTLFQEGDHFVIHCLRGEYAEGMESSSFIRLLRKMN